MREWVGGRGGDPVAAAIAIICAAGLAAIAVAIEPDLFARSPLPAEPAR